MPSAKYKYRDVAQRKPLFGLARRAPGAGWFNPCKRANSILAGAVLAVLCVFCAACGGEFDGTKIHNAAEHTPFHLDSEQATLTPAELDCGVDKDLWDAPVLVSERSVARLHQAARDLGFSDDVSVGEPGFINPYAQVRGDFMVRVTAIRDTQDGPGQGYKTVTGGLAVRIPHACFPEDLPLMGIHRGQFSPNDPVAMVFAFDNDDWHLDHLAH